MIFVRRWDRFQVCLEVLLIIEEQVGEFLQGKVRVFVSLNGAGVQCCGLVQCSGQANFVQTIEQVIDTDATFGAAVPLRENSM